MCKERRHAHAGRCHDVQLNLVLEANVNSVKGSPGLYRLSPDPQLVVTRDIKDSFECLADSKQALMYHIKTVRDVPSQQQHIGFPGSQAQHVNACAACMTCSTMVQDLG